MTVNQEVHEIPYNPSPNSLFQPPFDHSSRYINSLAPAARTTVLQFTRQYTLMQAGTGREVKAGPILLCIIIWESYIDTAFTSREVSLQLSLLDGYMVKTHSNIKQFNEHVNSLIMQLRARDEDTTDLLANLLKGYKCCSDRAFVDYVARLEDRIDDGEQIDSVTLMSRCLTKYLVKVQRNEWQTPMAEDEKSWPFSPRWRTSRPWPRPPQKGKPREPGRRTPGSSQGEGAVDEGQADGERRQHQES
jgi:hypothetical protein